MTKTIKSLSYKNKVVEPKVVDPQIIPTEETSPFRKLKQGADTNQLAKISAKRDSQGLDPITGTEKISKGALVIDLENSTDIKGFNTATKQLLDIIIMLITEEGCTSPKVDFHINEYIQLRGLSVKNKKGARKQINEGLDTLYNANLSYKDRILGRENGYRDMRIIDSKGIRNGIVTVTLGSQLFSILKEYSYMAYPPQLFKLNGHYNPNSYSMLRKIAEHKNMNMNKPNANTLSVKTLLDASPEIPPFEEVANSKGKQVTQRITDPFERDLNALDETLTWEYCKSGGEPLTDEELENFDYSLFISLLVKVHWKNYPELPN